MKKRWIFCLIAALVVPIVLIGIFSRRDVQIYLMPRRVVRSAILDTADMLSERFADNPALHIASVLETPEQQLHLQFPGQNTGAVIHLDPRTLEGQYQSDHIQGRFYADTESIAVSSAQLTGSHWYGICYDSFAEDISQIPLISWMVPDTLLRQWEAGLKAMRAGYLAQWSCPQIPSFSREDLSQLTLALASMKCEVTKTTITVEKTPQTCIRVHFRPGGLLSAIFPERSAKTDGFCSFYLQDGKLILAQISAEISDQEFFFQMESQKDSASNPVHVLITVKEGAREDVFSAEIETRQSSGILEESWDVGFNGRKIQFAYRWDPASGAGTLRSGDGDPIPVLFVPTEDGFHLETNDFTGLAAFFTEDFSIPGGFSHCILDAKPGKAPERPEFLTPNNWSAEDLLTLWEGVGSIVNIPIP